MTSRWRVAPYSRSPRPAGPTFSTSNGTSKPIRWCTSAPSEWKNFAINLSVRSGLKTHVKKVRAAASAGEAVSTAIVDAISALDKAVQRGIIHKNQAARRKSRMMKLAKTTATVASAPKEAKPAKKTVRKKKE